MELFGKDMIIGDFKLSDYGMMLASFDSGSSNVEEELGMDNEIIEEYIGNNPVPIYLGSKYKGKLKPQATIIKNPCLIKDTYFSEHECREVLRQLTGFRGYKNMQIYSYELDELLYFNIRVVNVLYKKVTGRVIGIILQMECDSQFAWSTEFTSSYSVKSGDTIFFYNTSDDLYNYLLPKIIITSTTSISNLEIKNISDNGWTTIISNIEPNETITMDSKNEILLSSNTDRIILNDFNMHFIRMVAGQNIIQVNSDINLAFNFRLPRKVGFICE